MVRAFTSPTIRRILAKRGQQVPSLTEALEDLAQKGFDRVAVQPTHLLPGIEYDGLASEAEALRNRFSQLLLGRPLLWEPSDEEMLVRALDEAFPSQEGEALVWMGHGTAHAAGGVYERLQRQFEALGRRDVFIATVEGSPTLDDARAWLRQGGWTNVHLSPLMLVAGDHALNDMAGDEPESWKNVLTGDGVQVRCTLRGLGTLEAVQALYAAHLRELLS
jgi:sirohydrochlorin cobaltochelatase